MTQRRRARWGDNDRYFGPFTYSRTRSNCLRLEMVLGSGDEDHPGCDLRFTMSSHTLIISLPSIIKPFREKIYVGSAWSAADIERMGRNWYWNYDEREYGFSYSEGFLQVFLGRQTHDSSTTQDWCKFLPWTQWQHIRRSFYGLNGELYYTESERLKFTDDHIEEWRKEQEIIDKCPSISFFFNDFDGEQLIATTTIEEREWRFGTGYFKWLSIFRYPKIRRSLNIRFSGETGERKGSWKGGTIGHGIDIESNETHESAFRRYCLEHKIIFIGQCDQPVKQEPPKIPIGYTENIKKTESLPPPYNVDFDDD